MASAMYSLKLQQSKGSRVSGSISNLDKSGVVSLVEDARVVGFLILASDYVVSAAIIHVSKQIICKYVGTIKRRAELIRLKLLSSSFRVLLNAPNNFSNQCTTVPANRIIQCSM